MEEDTFRYIGSATAIVPLQNGKKGISLRKQKHLVPGNYKRPVKSFHYQVMVHPNVKRGSQWLTLMAVGYSEDADEQEIHDKTVLVYMAEAMYTSYFQAYQSKVELELKQLNPFNEVEWLGTCSHPPLLDPLHDVVSANNAAQYSREYFKAYHQKYRLERLEAETPELLLRRQRPQALQKRESCARQAMTIEGLKPRKEN